MVTGTKFMLALLLAGLLNAQVGPTIRGQLLSEDGMPVSGSLYFWDPGTCSVMPTGTRCLPGANYPIKTDPEGRFQTGPVLPSIYYYIAGASGFLDSGNWRLPDVPGYVDVRNGQSISGQIIRLRRAAELEIRINDPQGLYFLPCATASLCSNLVVGFIFGHGAFQGAGNASSSAGGGITYRTSIPYGQPVSLWIYTKAYVMVDEAGNPVQLGMNGTFTVPPGTCKQRFVFTITGLASN
jgi:hypothetical protein